MVEGKEHKFQGFPEASWRLPGGFLEAFTVFHIQYDHSKGNGNVS